MTWEGGRVEPGEFEEFGFSARLPDEPTTLEFPAIQTYSSGEEVNWIGPPDSDEPAAIITTYSLGSGEEPQGELELLADLAAAETAATPTDDDETTSGVVLGVIGIALGLVALVVALTRRRPQ